MGIFVLPDHARNVQAGDGLREAALEIKKPKALAPD
jgi:hypothetical protein